MPKPGDVPGHHLNLETNIIMLRRHVALLLLSVFVLLPAIKSANEWTRAQRTKFGLQNAHLEAWGPFGRGWTLKRFSAQVSEPLNIPLIAYPKAWSPGTEGPLTAEVVYI